MNRRDLRRFEDIKKLMETKKSEDDISFFDKLSLIDLQIRDELK